MNEENDHIDVSEWLPQRFEYEYPHRIAKGDIAHNNGMIIKTLTGKLPIDRLFEDEEIIRDYHRDAGISFKILYDCAYGNAKHYGDKHDGGLSIDPKLKYAAVTHQLTKTQHRMVKWIIFETIDQADFALLRFHRSRVFDAFESLTNALLSDNVQKAIDIRRESATANTIHGPLVRPDLSQPSLA